jgi:hypothetical protein
MQLKVAVALLALLALVPLVNAFYVPGVAPRDFRDGEKVEIKVGAGGGSGCVGALPQGGVRQANRRG